VPGGEAIAIPDPLIWLSWVAAKTSTIRLATGILVLPQQHPLVIAKQVATLDRLSGGRVILGVGAGWLREEFDALDEPFDTRGARLDESIDVLQRAWRAGPVAYDGEQISFGSVYLEPKPVGRVPIVIGGHSRAAARRAGRCADGFFPLACQGDVLAMLVAIARSSAVDAGRDPASIEITAEAPRTRSDADVQAQIGVDRVLVNAPSSGREKLHNELQRRFDLTLEVLVDA
jgi:probable F420-dependent oxidoreductase